MPAVSAPPAFHAHERPPPDPALLWRAQTGWRAGDLRPSAWRIELPPTLAAQITARAAHTNTLSQAASGWVPDATAAPLSDRVEQMLESGIGFCLLHGLPLSGDSATDERAAFLLSLLFGRPVSQSRQGEFTARVENTGRNLKSIRVRGHDVAGALPFHCDRADRVLLACIRPARAGGHSRLASARALADILRAEAPHLAARLFRPMPQDRRGEQAAGQRPYMMMPVFAEADGIFVARYLRQFIHNAQLLPAAPRLTEEDIAALNALDALCERPGIAVEMPFAPGDIQIVNNTVILHGRTPFDDADDTDQRRLLLRIWLSHASARPLPDSFRELYGATAAGAYRGGIWPAGSRPVPFASAPNRPMLAQHHAPRS